MCSNTDRPGHDIIYRWVPTWRWFAPQTWKRGYFEVQRVLGPEDKQYFTKQGHRISKEKAINPSAKSVTFKQTWLGYTKEKEKNAKYSKNVDR